MKKVAEFYKVSFEQFKKDYLSMVNSNISDQELQNIYSSIKLPERATAGSAGYDMFLPFDISLKSNGEQSIPTGIRAKFKQDYALIILPKSGLGSKHQLHLKNTMALIDSDYYFSENQGHIIIPLILENKNLDASLSLSSGKAFVQGCFMQFGITKSDKVKGKRNGGFGSTNS